MNWYYVDAGQQTGPITDPQLLELVRAGKVQNETLVWHEGMPNWQPYYAVPPAVATGPELTPVPTPSFAPHEAVCRECGKVFPKQDMLAYGRLHVCAACKPLFVQKLAEGVTLSTASMNYAGFGIRLGAKMLDGIILGLIFAPPLFYFAFKAASSGQPAQFQLLQGAVQLIYVCASVGYNVFFLGKYGATPGKLACKLRVITVAGDNLTYGRATGRAFAEMLSGMICYAGYLMVAFDGERRALHDRICHTRVVYK
jgi:uncharacterized RDD family membrane protein YckC